MSNDVLSHAYTPAENAPVLSEALLNDTLSLEAAIASHGDASSMDVLDRIRTCD